MNSRHAAIAFLVLSLAANKPTRADWADTLTGPLMPCALYTAWHGALFFKFYRTIPTLTDVRQEPQDDADPAAVRNYHELIVFIEESLRAAGINPHSIHIIDLPFCVAGCVGKYLFLNLRWLAADFELPEPKRTHCLNAWHWIIAHEAGHTVHKDWFVRPAATLIAMTVTNRYLAQYLCPKNPFLKTLVRVPTLALASRILSNLIEHVCERRADAYATHCYRNEHTLLADAATGTLELYPQDSILMAHLRSWTYPIYTALLDAHGSIIARAERIAHSLPENQRIIVQQWLATEIAKPEPITINTRAWLKNLLFYKDSRNPNKIQTAQQQHSNDYTHSCEPAADQTAEIAQPPLAPARPAAKPKQQHKRAHSRNGKKSTGQKHAPKQKSRNKRK